MKRENGWWISLESSAKEKQEMRHRMKMSQRVLNLFLFGCVAYLVWYRWDSAREAQKNAKLQEIAWQVNKTGQDAQADDGEEQSTSGASPVTVENEAETQTQYMAGFEALLSINPDLKGWITIPGTTLSLPVVQGNDNSYYLSHDFYGEKDRHGTIFADCEADFGGGEKNTVLYGHNMRDGSMFGSLKAYREESYYKEHPSFFLYLSNEEREYEILAVLRNDILPGEEQLFQYYDYKNIETEEMFEEYYNEIKEHSLYEIDVEAQYGDELITLCTCDYGSKDQRLLVVGRKK